MAPTAHNELVLDSENPHSRSTVNQALGDAVATGLLGNPAIALCAVPLLIPVSALILSADSRIQSHALVIMPAPIPHPSALGRDPTETVFDDQGAPKPLSVRLDVLLDPLFASGSERAEQENCALIANQYVRGIRDNLRRTAHGCVLLCSNTHQVTKQKKRPRIRRCRGDHLHSVPHQPFGLPPCVSKRRLAALSRCPDADSILPASAIGWNGTKVWNVINRGARGFLSEHWVRLRNSQAKTDPRVASDIPPLLYREGELGKYGENLPSALDYLYTHDKGAFEKLQSLGERCGSRS